MATNGTSKSTCEDNGLKIPQHVAIIMDGNGRWANQRGLARLAGHRVGLDNLHRIVSTFAKYHVPFLTLYAFSTENWTRPLKEVTGIMKMMEEVITKETPTLHEHGVRIRHLGRLDRLSKNLQKAVHYAQDLTQNNDHITLCIAFDYGGRAEILQAVNRLLTQNPLPTLITEQMLNEHLYTAGIPDPDLIIRTAGELRLSNFLLWQSAYSEYYPTSTLWPDFDEKEILKALQAYSHRKRRFGAVKPKA